MPRLSKLLYQHRWNRVLVVLALVVGSFILYQCKLSKNIIYIGYDERSPYSTPALLIALQASLMKYKIDCGDYPTTEEGLSALLQAPASKKARWTGPYWAGEIKDSWGNPLVYYYPGRDNEDRYELFSLGPDGVVSDDDIYQGMNLIGEFHDE